MKKFFRLSLAILFVLSLMAVSFANSSTPAQASDNKVYTGTNIVIPAGSSYELTPDTDGVIAGTLVITSNKAGYWIQGCNPNKTWTTVIFYGPKSGTFPVSNNGTRVKNVLSSSITISYTLTCVSTWGPFVAEDEDDAAHTSTPDLNYEWWYFDANFTNGYSATVIFFYPYNFVECSVYDPQGNCVKSDAVFATGSASTTKCDVQLGTGNRFWGSYPDWHVEYMNNGNGVDLDMHSLVEGWKTPTTGVKIMTVDPYTWMGWVVAQPRSSVTGTIYVNGTPISVTGIGYHDHNWGNTPLADQFDHWYWGRIFLPGYTMVYSVGNMTEELGYGTNNLWITFKDKTFVDVNLGVTATEENLVLDPVTNHTYPSHMVWTLPPVSTVIGTVTLDVGQLIESYVMPDSENGAYFRFLGNGTINLIHNGTPIQTTQPLLWEYMVP